ncbi:MAG: transposase [Anaerolineales bacterium]|nr:transposase [Anaerolineales bacterium]
MKNSKIFDLYSDYTIYAFGQTTATGLSALFGRRNQPRPNPTDAGYASADFGDWWRVVKPHVRQMESEKGILMVDDRIAEKSYTDKNEIICWHSDHARQRNVKGINFVTCFYHSRGVSLPIGFELVRKTPRNTDPKEGKEKRRSEKTKHEISRDLLQQAVKNCIPFRYVLNDLWFALAENRKYVKLRLKKEFFMPLKGNCKGCLSMAAKQQGRYRRVETLEREAMKPVRVYLRGVEFALLLVKQVFTNEDGLTSETPVDGNGIGAIDQKRWDVKPDHKSLKQNALLEKSPTQTVTTQTNHFFAALCGDIKLELFKGETKLKPFALKSKLYLRAIQSAFADLRELKPAYLAT